MVDRQGPGELTPVGPPAGRLRIATRESRLALWQAHHVRDRLLGLDGARAVDLLGMTTRGDQILDRPLAEIGGKGLFTKELETALLDGRADLAVHSLKDVPMDLPDAFEIAAILVREDPRDALVSPRHESLDALPTGAVVGTSSLRRAAQLRALRPDLDVQPLRGNLDTRLAKLDAGGYDAIVLAAAGLKRLGLAARIRAPIPADRMLPSPGQGALALEIRAGDVETGRQLQPLDDRDTRLAVQAERAVSRMLGGNCRTPLGAHAVFDTAGDLRLDGILADAGGRLAHASETARVATDAEAIALGERVAARLASAIG
ncbi:MAG: hydroxymethylbilane synthase [Lautropia sp.]